MGETSDHVGITLIQLAPRRMSNVRPPNLKRIVWKFYVLDVQNCQDLLPGTLHYIHEEKIYINISAIL